MGELPSIFTFSALIFWYEPPSVFMYASGFHLENQWFIYLYATLDFVRFHFALNSDFLRNKNEHCLSLDSFL